MEDNTNSIISLDDLMKIVNIKEERQKNIDEINSVTNDFKDKKLSIELDNIERELKTAKDVLGRMNASNEKGQQLMYIKELESNRDKIQQEIDRKKEEKLASLNKKISRLEKQENAILSNFNKKREEKIAEINEKLDYYEKLKADAIISLNEADESLKDTYTETISGCDESIALCKQEQDELLNINLEELIERAGYAKELIDKINQENKNIQNEINNDFNTRMNKKKLKQNEILSGMVVKSIFDKNLDINSFKNNLNATLNNFNRRNQIVNFGGYDMTRGQALEELSSLYARLENEDFLDTIDNPDYNEQDILNRIALLEDALGINLKDDSFKDPGQDDPGHDDPGHDDPGHDDPGHDDPGHDDPGHDDPGHDDPGHDDPGHDDPGHDDPGHDDPGTKKALVKSGLQIFREQFNQMPEIKRRHTASERLPFYQTALGIGGIAALSLANPLVGIPLIAVTPLLKPIVRGVTGQGRIENEIAEQFRDLKDANPEEFDRMVRYLSEEKIQDLKPNAVILNALHKVSIERTAEKIEALQIETNRLESARNDLLSRNPNTLSAQDMNTLAYINDRLIEINEGHHETDQNGNVRFIEGEAKQIENTYKDLKRGKDRVSQRYKGNLLSRFNIFAHRNTDSKTYRGPINDLADAEYTRDMMILAGDNRTAATSQHRMDEIMAENTHTNFLGVQNSVFNDRRSRKTGPVRIMSDQKDNTYRNLFTLASIAGTLHAAHNIANRTKIDLTGDKNLAQRAANAEQANVYAQGETAAVRANKTTEAPGYEMSDQIANKLGNSAKVTIRSDKLSDQLRTLGDQISGNKSAAQALQSASRRNAEVHYSVDHSQQIAVQSNMVTNTEAKAQILKNAADLIDNLEKNGSTVVKNAFVGPIVAGIGALQRVASSFVNNIKEARDNSEAGGR